MSSTSKRARYGGRTTCAPISRWTQKTRELLGGTRGCTHLLELLGPMATTAFQTVYSLREKRAREQGVRKRPALIDSCHAWASDSEMVEKRFPEFYTGPKKAAG
jgi:hypothetical protein